MTPERSVWQEAEVVRGYLERVRAGRLLAAEQVEVLLRVVAARGEAVRRLVDLGAGDGVLAALVLERYPDAEAVLVDFSEPMLSEARDRFQGGEKKVSFVLADLRESSWVRQLTRQAPFDLIVSGYAIHHLEDHRKRQLYQETYELLGPGGLFVNMEHVSSPSPWVESIFEEWQIDSNHDAQAGQAGARSRAEVAEEYANRRDRLANIFAPVETQCDWLREIGFQDVDCFFKAFEYAVFGGRRLAP